MSNPNQVSDTRGDLPAGREPWLAYSGRCAASTMTGVLGGQPKDHATLDGVTTLCGMKEISQNRDVMFDCDGAYSCKHCARRVRALDVAQLNRSTEQLRELTAIMRNAARGGVSGDTTGRRQTGPRTTDAGNRLPDQPLTPLTVPAGRELDALVADRVMGFAHSECRAAEEDVWISHDGVLWFQLPAYSTAIYAAWDVVERLTRTTKQWFRFEQSCVTWVATFATEGSGDIDAEHSAEGGSAPHAICLAALKAVAP